MLDVVQVEEGVVPQGQGEVDALDLPAGRGVPGLRRVERRDRAADGGPVHLDEGEPQAARHILHEGRLAVAGRGDQEQQTAAGASGVAALAGHRPRSDLASEVVPDQGQVDLVDEPVADEVAHDPGLELAHPQAPPLALQDLGAQLLEGPEGRYPLAAEGLQAGQEGVEAQGQGPALDARVLPQEALHPGDRRGAHRAALEDPFREDQLGRLPQDAGGDRVEGLEGLVAVVLALWPGGVVPEGVVPEGVVPGGIVLRGISTRCVGGFGAGLGRC